MSEYRAFLGGEPIVIRFEFYGADDGGRDYPSSPAYIEIDAVKIGKVWVSYDSFSDRWLTEKEDEILADIGRSLQAEHDMSRWEANQEYLMEQGYP